MCHIEHGFLKVSLILSNSERKICGKVMTLYTNLTWNRNTSYISAHMYYKARYFLSYWPM